MLVRAVQKADIPGLFELLQAKAAFDGVADSLVASPATLEAVLFGEQRPISALVAEEGGHLIGMATYYRTFSSFIAKPCLWLDDLYVREPHRAQGVGRELMKHLCREAEATGCGRVDWVVGATNAEGRGFYQRLGSTIFESVRLARLDDKAIRSLAAESD